MSGYLPVTNVTFVAIVLTIIFGIFYIATASIGVKTYNDCKEIQGVKKWDNLKMLLTHTMTMSMMIPAVLIAQRFAGGKVAAAMAIIYGIMGLVGNATAFAMTKEGACGEVTKEDSKNYLIFGMIASLLIMLGGSVYLSGKNKSAYN